MGKLKPKFMKGIMMIHQWMERGNLCSDQPTWKKRSDRNKLEATAKLTSFDWSPEGMSCQVTATDRWIKANDLVTSGFSRSTKRTCWWMRSSPAPTTGTLGHPNPSEKYANLHQDCQNWCPYPMSDGLWQTKSKPKEYPQQQQLHEKVSKCLWEWCLKTVWDKPR